MPERTSLERSTAMASRDVYIGFDFGTKNIGVAIGQRITGTAAPLQTIRIGRRQDQWGAISEIVTTWQPAAFVVGLAYPAEGIENPIVPMTMRFCRQLEGRYGLPVHVIDETLSTAESRQRFFAQGNQKASEFLEQKDQLAAQLILQSWLDQVD